MSSPLQINKVPQRPTPSPSTSSLDSQKPKPPVFQRLLRSVTPSRLHPRLPPRLPSTENPHEKEEDLSKSCGPETPKQSKYPFSSIRRDLENYKNLHHSQEHDDHKENSYTLDSSLQKNLCDSEKEVSYKSEQLPESSEKWGPQAWESPYSEDILKSARYPDGQLDLAGAVPPPPTTPGDIQTYESLGNRLYLHRLETVLCRRLDFPFELLSRQLEDKMNRAIDTMLGNVAEHETRLRALEAAMARRHDRELAELKTTIERLSRERHEGGSMQMGASNRG